MKHSNNDTMDKLKNGVDILISNIFGDDCNYINDLNLDYITFYRHECYSCPDYETLITNDEYILHDEVLMIPKELIEIIDDDNLDIIEGSIDFFTNWKCTKYEDDTKSGKINYFDRLLRKGKDTMTINEILDLLVDKCHDLGSYEIYYDNGDVMFQHMHKCHCSNCDGHLCTLIIPINIIKNFNETTIFILKKWIKKQEWKEW